MYVLFFVRQRKYSGLNFSRKRYAWYAVIVRKGGTDPFDILHIKLYTMILHVVLALPNDEFGGSKFWVIGRQYCFLQIKRTKCICYVADLQKTHLLEKK